MPTDLLQGRLNPTTPGGQPRDLLEGRLTPPTAPVPQQAAQAPQQPGILSRIGKTLNDGLNPFGVVSDIKDVVQQGVTKTDSFPYFRLPESIGQRAEDRKDAISNIAPYMIGGAGPIAAGARGMALRAGGSAVGAGLSSVEQQAQAGQGFSPSQTAAAMALGGAGQGVGDVVGAALTGSVRALVRGGAQGRQGMQQAIADAARVGQTPTLAQATQSSMLDSFESILTKVPGSAGRIRDTVRATTAGVREGLENIASKGSSKVFDAEAAGQAIIGGVDDFVGRFQGRAGPLFDQITSSVGADTPVAVSNTLNNLLTRTASIPGAERTGQRFVSPFIRSLADDLVADAGASGQLPFQALQRVRSLVGEQLSNPGIVSDVPTAQLKQLYGAISDDIRAAANAAGPDAARAFSRANAFYRAGQQRIQNTLEPLVKNKTPERVFQSLMSGAKTGPTQIRTLYRSLTPAQEDIVTGSIIRKLGTANPGQQGAEGADFSFSTFLTRWNQIDGKARDAIFNRGRNVTMGQDINALARYAERVKESSRAFANPSGTAGAQMGGVAALVGAGSVVTAPVLGAGVLTFPVILAGGAGAANVAARMMTSPRVVNWLAQSTKIGAPGVANHLTRLGAIAKKEDPEVQAAIAEYFQMLDSPLDAGQNGRPPAGGNPDGTNAQGLLEGQMGVAGQPGAAAMGQGQAQQAQQQAIMEELARAQQGAGPQLAAQQAPQQAPNPQLSAMMQQAQQLQSPGGQSQIQAQLMAAQQQEKLAEEQRAMLRRFAAGSP